MRLHWVSVDPRRKLVEVRLTNDRLSPEDAGWIGEELRAAILSLGDAVGEHVTLYDATALHGLPVATIDAIKAMFENPRVRPLWARKVAFVTTSALARLQVGRIRRARADIANFDTRAAALEWLLT